MPIKGEQLSTETVAALLEQGWTQAEIAEAVGVSKQAVHYHARKLGHITTRREVTNALPWQDLTDDHKRATPYLMIRRHVEYKLKGQTNMSEDSIRRLRSWYEQYILGMGYVVEYDPSIPPAPSQKFGGWRYVKRERRDENRIIRENEYTKLTPAQKKLFTIPETIP